MADDKPCAYNHIGNWWKSNFQLHNVCSQSILLKAPSRVVDVSYIIWHPLECLRKEV